MVVVRIQCGLGNQLFQYAAATALGARLQAPVAADLSWFQGANRRRGRRDRRDYLLPRLGLVLPVAGEEQIASFHPSWWRRCLGAKPRGIVLTQGVDPGLQRLEAAAGDVYLDGYWQGEPFFRESTAALRPTLLALAPARPMEPWRAALQEEGTVAMHVRRGDYAHSASPRALLGPLDEAYYRRAAASLGAVRAIVFSDEPAWCEAEFRPGIPFRCVSHDDPAAATLDDLLTLGHARSLIIANSTLSWWGGWLATQRGARVVAPSRWFANRAYAAWEPLLAVPGWTWV